MIGEALRAIGDRTAVRESAAVGGGSISRATRLRTGRSEYLLKSGGAGLPGFFAAEARGLGLLADTGAMRVPKVLVWRDGAFGAGQYPAGQTQDTGSGFILLEWIEGPPQADRSAAAAQLGAALAAMHQSSAKAYGLDHDNYIGATPQPNGVMDSWLAFFRDRRLGFQAELARRNGRMSGDRARRMDRLLERLDQWIDDKSVRPALLHGDLWGGNFIVGPGNTPVLIDPAVYYGDREADLAMTRLFGGFAPSFYSAYAQAWPLPEGWAERVQLYNLYHLLNHLNLFGEGYGAEVDATLAYYAG